MRDFYIRMGRIAYIVDRLQSLSPQVGKTVLQKIMYLVNSTENWYDFTLYHYGPFSSMFEADINHAEDFDAVGINWIPNIGYQITPGKNIAYFTGMVPEEEKKIMDEIIEKLGGFNARDLSIMATAHYIKRQKSDISSEELARIVRILKPKFDLGMIASVIATATDLGVI